MLTIEVETIDFDTQACTLRLKGRNVEENEYIKVYHNETVTSREFELNIFIIFRWGPTTHLILRPIGSSP